MTDFLNDTTEFKRSLLQNGLSEDVADAFLNSNIKMTADEQASYNLAKVLCKISKRKLITDSEFILKEFNVSAITNYVTFIYF